VTDGVVVAPGARHRRSILVAGGDGAPIASPLTIEP
jgi:hypothetical protein